MSFLDELLNPKRRMSPEQREAEIKLQEEELATLKREVELKKSQEANKEQIKRLKEQLRK